MSYDLTLVFRPALEKADFVDFLSSRKNYVIGDAQCVYKNENTGVYFGINLEYSSGRDVLAQVVCHINYCRPSFFGPEAEGEIAAIVARFSPTIRNPQGNDTQGNPYSADEFLTGWQAGNILAIGVMESASPAECAMRTIPHDVLVRSWEWNVTLVARREQLERDQFIPRMIYLLIEGQARTAIIWGDGVAAMLPQVDYVLVAQVHEGERRFGCVSWDYFSTVMQQAGHAAHEGFDLYEPQGPGLVSALIETAMPFNRETMGILQADVVLDEADVRAALAA